MRVRPPVVRLAALAVCLAGAPVLTVAGAAAAGPVATGPLGIAAAPTAPEALSSDPADYDSDGDGRPDQPSEVLAVELATRLGVEVEVLSLRSESQTVLADAEGVLSVEDFGSPIRIQTDPEGADDGWVEVDYDLEETSDGVWAPKASPADVVVNDTVDGVLEAARVTYEDGSSVAVTWPEDNPGELGDPVVEGGVATYPLEGFSGSVDLVVAMTTTGASTWLRINEALSAEETAAIESEGVTFGLRTSGPARPGTPATRGTLLSTS